MGKEPLIETEIDRYWEKKNNITNWEQGCYECKLPFREDEVFARVDTEEDVFCFHKRGKCLEEGHRKVREGEYTNSNIPPNY